MAIGSPELRFGEDTTKNVNKVEIDGVVKLDLTEDTVTPATLLLGYTAHDKSGQKILGTFNPRAKLFQDNVALDDGLLRFDVDLQACLSGMCNCLIIECIGASEYKAFVWLLGRTWQATYSSSQGLSIRTDVVSVSTSVEAGTAHFDIELSDSGGTFYAGSVRIYGWDV